MLETSFEDNIRVQDEYEDNIIDKNKRIYDFFRRKKDVIQNFNSNSIYNDPGIKLANHL